MNDFVLLSDVVPDIILEMRYYSTYNFVGKRIIGYEEPIAILTKKAANYLKAVSDELISKGYRLKVYDAYRPASAVNDFINWSKNSDEKMKTYFYPTIEKSRLFESGYIAEKSSHSRGSSVDVTLLDIDTGKEVDMGGVFDYFGEISHSDYTSLTKVQFKNRKILSDVMIKHGFSPIKSEWWHFTLKNEPYPDTYFNFPVNRKSVEDKKI